MANKTTVLKCLKQLELAYGKTEDSEARALLYVDILSDLPDEALTKATRDHIASSKWYPKPAELRELAIAVSDNHNSSTQFDEPETEGEYRRRLYWSAMADFNSYDELTMRTSKALGWWRKQQPVVEDAL